MLAIVSITLSAFEMDYEINKLKLSFAHLCLHYIIDLPHIHSSNISLTHLSYLVLHQSYEWTYHNHNRPNLLGVAASQHVKCSWEKGVTKGYSTRGR